MTAIFSAFTTTTKSPVSQCRVYQGERLPERVSAMTDASRPRFWPSASTMYHWRSTVPGFALTVLTCGSDLFH